MLTIMTDTTALIISCVGGRHNMPQPLQVDLWPFDLGSGVRVTWSTSVPILVFLGLPVLNLGPMYTTDRQTSDVHHHLMPLPMGRGITSCAACSAAATICPCVCKWWLEQLGNLDLWPWNWCAMSPVARTTFLPILVLVRLFFVELWANTSQTDVMLRRRP